MKSTELMIGDWVRLQSVDYANGVIRYVEENKRVTVDHLSRLEKQELKIVRDDNIYAININSIGGYGSPIYIGTSSIVTPPEYPQDPDDEETSFVSAEVRILSWRIVSQGVNIQPTPGV